MAHIPWRESLSAPLAISRARSSAAATDKVCRETVWCLRLCRNFQFHSTSCWPLRDQRPVAGDHGQQPPIP